MSKVILIMIAIIVLVNIGLGIYQLKRGKRELIGIMLCSGIMAGMLGMFLAFLVVQTPKEVVRIEIEPDVSANGELFLQEISVDGKFVKIPEPIDGKWVWRGENYGWFDTSQTVVENVTKAIKIKISVGYQRVLVFNADKIAGNLKVQCGEYIQDVHLGDNDEIEVTLPASQQKTLFFYKLIQIVAFIIASGILHLLFFNMLQRGKTKIRPILYKYRYHIVYGTLAVVSLAYMIYNSERDSLWYDEMHTLGYALGKNPPNSAYIVFALMKGYLKMIPYGQVYILLLSEICVAISVYVVGLIGKRLRNGKTGVYASAILAFAPYVYHQVAYEYRTYFMLLLSTTIMLYLVVVRESYNNREAWWFILIYSFCNMLVMDSHEYGKLVAGMIIFVDIMLIFVKKISKKYILSFILPIGYAIYWLVNNEVGGLWNNYSWPPNPTPAIVYNTINTLLGKNSILVFFFGLGCAFVVGKVIKEYKETKEIRNVEMGYVVSLFMIIAIFGASIIYSDFINPQNSLYVNRYFISIIIFMFILIAVGLDFFLETILKNADNFSHNVITVACVGTIICMGWQGYICSKDEHSQLYRETAQYMNCQKDVYDADTMVFIPDNGYVVTAWSYYFTEGGKKDSVNIKGKYNIDLEKCEYNKIYVVTPAYQPTEEQQVWLNENYRLDYVVEGYPICAYVRK